MTLYYSFVAFDVRRILDHKKLLGRIGEKNSGGRRKSGEVLVREKVIGRFDWIKVSDIEQQETDRTEMEYYRILMDETCEPIR